MSEGGAVVVLIDVVGPVTLAPSLGDRLASRWKARVKALVLVGERHASLASPRPLLPCSCGGHLESKFTEQIAL